MEDVESAYDYLWRIRNELHFQSKRKTDQIQFDKQEQIAAFLGYQDNKKALSVEQFMQDYYSHATSTEHLATSLIFKAYKEKVVSTVDAKAAILKAKNAQDMLNQVRELKILMET